LISDQISLHSVQLPLYIGKDWGVNMILGLYTTFWGIFGKEGGGTGEKGREDEGTPLSTRGYQKRKDISFQV
jgi:hypothetical protein